MTAGGTNPCNTVETPDTNRSQIKPLDQNNAASLGDVASKSSGGTPLTAANLPEAAAAVDHPTLSSNLGNLNGSKHGVLEPQFPDVQPQDVKRTKGIQDQVSFGVKTCCMWFAF